MRYFIFVVLSSLAIAAKANLPEPLHSDKNSYISCVDATVEQTLNANQEVTELLLRTSCPNELASLVAVVPQNMKAGFFEQLQKEVARNMHKQLTP